MNDQPVQHMQNQITALSPLAAGLTQNVSLQRKNVKLVTAAAWCPRYCWQSQYPALVKFEGTAWLWSSVCIASDVCESSRSTIVCNLKHITAMQHRL
jgi:hypothetical protein